jgi:predicted nuclease of predicted toxin-antitoxin system
MDVHVRNAIVRGLRRLGVDVLTSQEDGTTEMDDAVLLTHASELGRALFTSDADFLVEAARRQHAGIPFAGVIYVHQRNVSVSNCVADLELIAKLNDPPDLENVVVYLPL